MKTFEEVDDMLLSEYHLLMKAYSLKRLDKERELHMQAFLNMAVQSTKEKGKKSVPVYPKFKDFFDYESMEKEMLGVKEVKQDKNAKLKELILKANKKGG